MSEEMVAEPRWFIKAASTLMLTIMVGGFGQFVYAVTWASETGEKISNLERAQEQMQTLPPRITRLEVEVQHIKASTARIESQQKENSIEFRRKLNQIIQSGTR